MYTRICIHIYIIIYIYIIIIITSHDYCIGSLYIYILCIRRQAWISIVIHGDLTRKVTTIAERPIQVSVLKSPEKKEKTIDSPERREQ